MVRWRIQDEGIWNARVVLERGHRDPRVGDVHHDPRAWALPNAGRVPDPAVPDLPHSEDVINRTGDRSNDRRKKGKIHRVDPDFGQL